MTRPDLFNCSLAKVPAEWRLLWISEGWDVFWNDDTRMWVIQKIDNSAEFDPPPEREWPDDESAINWVVGRALTGSRPHLLAIWLDGKSPERKLVDPWIPDNLLSTG